MTKTNQGNAAREAVARANHTLKNGPDDDGLVSRSTLLNQYRCTSRGALVDGVTSSKRVSDGATIADVLQYLFEHDDEVDLFSGILAGISEELEVLGVLLMADEQSAPMVGPLVVRLAKRLDLALAFERRRAADPSNYDLEDNERKSGEFAVTEVPARRSLLGGSRRATGDAT